jgi:hypothetical protein
MFKRFLISITSAVIGSLLFALPASAAPLSEYTDYLTDDFYAVFHYQGAVDNPIRDFGETLFDALDGTDFVDKDIRKVMDLADAHFLQNDLLFVADLAQELAYMGIPMSENDVESFIEFIEEEEAVKEVIVDGQVIYTSFSGDNFAFTHWDGVLLVTDSQMALSAIVSDLEDKQVSPLVRYFDEMPTNGFISAFVSNDITSIGEFQDEELEAFGDLFEISDYTWYVSQDLGDDHYSVDQYTSWNDELLSSNDFDFADFTFAPALYQTLPGEDVMFYFETHDVYDYAMALIDLLNLEEILGMEEEVGLVSTADGQLKPSNSGATEVFQTIEDYRPYLELLNDRLGVVVQLVEGAELPLVTFLTEVGDDDLDTIRTLHELVLPFITEDSCYSVCPEITTEDQNEGALYTITQSLTQEVIDVGVEELYGDIEGELIFDYSDFYEPYERTFTFGESNGFYVASNDEDILEQLESPTNTLADNSDFMGYFNRYAAGLSDLSYVAFYDLSTLVSFALNSFPYGGADITEATEFLTDIGPWYSQGRAADDWTRSVSELVLPIRAAIDSLVPLMVAQWEEQADSAFGAEFEANMQFDDLAYEDTSWYAEELVSLAADDVVDATQDEFRPNDPISRAEFATLVVRHYGWEGLDPEMNGSEIFDDVSEDVWYDAGIGLAYENGILSGDDTGNTVRPDDPITRAEAAQVLVNVSGTLQAPASQRADFDDVGNFEWYSDAVDRTYDREIVTGVTETTFEPSRPLTRAEAIVLINRVRESEFRFDWVF